MSLSFSPARAHIDLNAIKRNFQRFGAADKILPVVKCDAYGHGLLPTSRALLAVGARRFAVGTVAEGVALREAGIKVRIVVLLPRSAETSGAPPRPLASPPSSPASRTSSAPRPAPPRTIPSTSPSRSRPACTAWASARSSCPS